MGNCREKATIPGKVLRERPLFTSIATTLLPRARTKSTSRLRADQ